jgi:hypothetical protein
MNCELVKYGYESEQMKGQIHAMLWCPGLSTIVDWSTA